jgi:hypothetical protein
MTLFELAELLSYVVTIVGLPFAILVFLYERRKAQRTEEEELYQRLSDEYASFLRLALEHADLKLFRAQAVGEPLTDEQLERKNILFGLLVSLFERAYLLVYERDMSDHQRRLWMSWEDYIREWLRREDFRAALPELLKGEDDDFVALVQALARDEDARMGKKS